jgi:XTP/dITP diphosphohydrolase
MKLVIASNNSKKRNEIEAILGTLGIEILPAAQTVHVEVEEDADSFAGNAQKKAEAFAAVNQCAALADDSGLCVDALDGAPGIYSSRFAGDSASDAENNSRLLQEMSGVKLRTAHFTCVICLSMPDGRSLLAEGQVNGVIGESPSGSHGFGYDPLFYCPELGKVFADSSAEEKASVSHRGRALKRLRDILSTSDILND